LIYLIYRERRRRRELLSRYAIRTGAFREAYQSLLSSNYADHNGKKNAGILGITTISVLSYKEKIALIIAEERNFAFYFARSFGTLGTFRLLRSVL
jgi:hypothetical protein